MKIAKFALSLVVAIGLALPIAAQENVAQKEVSRLEKIKKMATSKASKIGFYSFELALGAGLLVTAIAKGSIPEMVETLTLKERPMGSDEETRDWFGFVFATGAHTATLLLIGHGIDGLKREVGNPRKFLHDIAQQIVDKMKDSQREQK